MNRIEIKEQAKKLLKGNIWNIWKPLLIIYLITIMFGFILGFLGVSDESLLGRILTLLVEIAIAPVSIGYMYYILNIVRGKAFGLNDLYKFYGNIWTIFGTIILTGLIILGGTLLFVIPGIIFSYMYIMTNYILADGEKNVINTLRKSKEMMKGYKMDFFVFQLSFIGWILLTLVTFGIAIIYVLPYMNLAQTIYYDKLKALQSK